MDSKFAKMVEAERERFNTALAKCNERKVTIDDEIAGIMQELNAVNAYDAAKTGKRAATGKRRTGIRSDVLDVIKVQPHGIVRSALLNEMGVKGDKSGEQSVSNALSALKKAGTITAVDGKYKVT